MAKDKFDSEHNQKTRIIPRNELPGKQEAIDKNRIKIRKIIDNKLETNNNATPIIGLGSFAGIEPPYGRTPPKVPNHLRIEDTKRSK